MATQTYSPYRHSGRALPSQAGLGRPAPQRRSALPQAILAPKDEDDFGGTAAILSPNPAAAGGLGDPAARRWVLLGALGLVSSLLLTVGVALMSSRGVASADVPKVAAPAAQQNRVTMVREIGGVQRAATPGAGSVAAAPGVAGSTDPSAAQSVTSAALRQLRRVGRAIVTTDGVRKLALGGAVPFVDGAATTTSAYLSDDRGAQVALADTVDPSDDANTVFLSANAVRDESLLSMLGATDRAVAAQASPSPLDTLPTATTVPPTATSVPPTPTPVPPTATSVPPTATSVPPTATSVPPTATSVPATATSVPATSAPIVVTATPQPATQTPVVVTATPEPTSKATRTPIVDAGPIIIVTATPWTAIIPNSLIPFTQPAPTNTPSTILPFMLAPNTPVPTATAQVIATVPAKPQVNSEPSTASAPAQAVAPSTRRSEPATSTAPSGPAPILTEPGTRTPTGPAPRSTARQPAAPTGSVTANANAAPAQQNPEAPREPSVLEKLAARALLAVNAARAQAGALPLARNAALDTASALHAQYDVTTGQAEGNFQTRGTPLFVGETPGARVARAAGRTGAVERVAEVMALGETDPERAVQGWMDSVFHRAVLLDLAAQYGGFGQHTSGSATTAVMDLGGKRDVANASGWFPAAGMADVPTRCVCDDYAEATGKNGPFGYPVTLLLGQVRPQGMPTVARLTKNAEDGPVIPTDLVDAYGNPTLVPLSPLEPTTRYFVRIAWANGPSVSWSFTTTGQ